MVRMPFFSSPESWIKDIEKRHASEERLADWQERVEAQRIVQSNPNIKPLGSFEFVIEPVAEPESPRHVHIIETEQRGETKPDTA